MAVTAKFVADFSSFSAAVDAADVQLKSFEQGAGKVETSLTRMANSLYGTKVIQEATLMAAAIEKVGGVSTLTEKELARVGAVAQEAAAKLTALGQGVPEKIQAIADAAARGGQATEGWVGILSELGHSWVARVAEGILLRDAIREVISVIGDAAKALPEIALKGAAVADVEENFKRLTAQAGFLGETLLGALRTGTHNTITDFELMKTANQDLAAGLNLTDKQFGTLAQGAFALAQATGTDVKTALDTMNDAMLTGRTRALALLTGKIDLTKAEQDYAKSLGTDVEHLSDAGKLEAARVGILQSVAEATRRLGDQTDGLDERVAQVQASWANFTENLGKTIATSATLEAGLSGLKRVIEEALGGSQEKAIHAIAGAVDDVLLSVVSLGEVGVEAAGFIVKEWYAAEKVFGDIAQVIDGVRFSILSAQQAASLGLLPGTSVDLQRWKELDDQVAKLEITMSRRGAALQQDEQQQSAVDATTGKYIATLGTLRSEMEAARAGTGDHAVATNALAVATDHAATAAGLHAGQLKISAAEIAKAKADAKAFADAMEEVASVGASFSKTLETIDGRIVESSEDYVRAGLSLKALKEMYGLTETQVKALTETVKAQDEAQKLSAKQAADSTARWEEYNALLTEMSGTATDRQIANIERWEAAQIKAHVDAKTDTADFYDWLSAEEAKLYQKADLARLQADSHSKAHFDKVAQDAEDAYNYAVAHWDQFPPYWVEMLRKTMVSADQAAAHWSTSMGGAVQQITDRIQALSGAWETVAEKAKRQAGGGSFALPELTSQQFQQAGGADRIKQIEAGYLVNPGRQEGGSGSTGLLPNDDAGWLAILAERRLYQELKNYAAQSGGVTSAPPLLASPATGSSWAPSGGVTVNAPITVSGLLDPATMTQLAQGVSAQVMQSVLRATQRGA